MITRDMEKLIKDAFPFSDGSFGCNKCGHIWTPKTYRKVEDEKAYAVYANPIYCEKCFPTKSVRRGYEPIQEDC